jgi:hypothetical protein
MPYDPDRILSLEIFERTYWDREISYLHPHTVSFKTLIFSVHNFKGRGLVKQEEMEIFT